MSYRDLQRHPVESAAFYHSALAYGHYLWLHAHAGRAILAITRALYAPLPIDSTIYQQWPLPYAALKWIVTQHPQDDFPGNPRISFQHQATRLRGPQQALRRARATAVWALICQARPSLPPDENDPATLPPVSTIAAQLNQHGLPQEAQIWLTCLLHEVQK